MTRPAPRSPAVRRRGGGDRAGPAGGARRVALVPRPHGPQIRACLPALPAALHQPVSGERVMAAAPSSCAALLPCPTRSSSCCCLLLPAATRAARLSGRRMWSGAGASSLPAFAACGARWAGAQAWLRACPPLALPACRSQRSASQHLPCLPSPSIPAAVGAPAAHAADGSAGSHSNAGRHLLSASSVLCRAVPAPLCRALQCRAALRCVVHIPTLPSASLLLLPPATGAPPSTSRARCGAC